MMRRFMRLVDVFGAEEDSAFRRPLDETRVAVSHRPYPTDRASRQRRPRHMKARETTEAGW
jgi:hypothetical protein